MNDRDFMDFIELQFSEEELAQFDDEQQYYDLLAHEFGLPFESEAKKEAQISKEAEESLIRLDEMLENGETPSDEEVNDLLDLRGDLHDKLLNYGKFIKNNSSDIDTLDGEIRRLSAKKRALNNLNECLKSNMLAAMQANDIKKVDDPIIPIRRQKSIPSVCLDINADRLPKEFQKMEIKANHVAIAKALKDGIVIDGANLVQNEHIRIG